ncbi:MAG: putative bifunctional diguanylate cyclase/phosphodiesterase [Devosia sp.]
MRRNHALSKIIEGYRSVAIAAGVVVAALFAASVMVLLGRSPQAGIMLPGVVLMAGALVLALLAGGERMIRTRVAFAAKASNDIMASIHRDALTGVATRAHFLAALRNEVYHGSARAVGYLQLDMDNLKVLNDSAGHGAGDAALLHLAATIRDMLPNALVGRLGGDEFGIAVLGHDNRPALKRLGEELLRRLERPVAIAGRPVRLAATIGVALAPLDATDVAELISKADLALYKGKKSGRHMVVAFDPDMLGDERHRRFVERELRAALLLDELELHYQPVFDSDRVIKSHEALIRWRHKVRGIIPPGQFIAIAEESDLIDKLGEWVLRRACLDLPRLGTPVAVNVSPAQLRHADFAPRFAALLTETGTDPRSIIVEITETVPLQVRGIELANVDALRALGVRIAIDDFGAGHASLQYLRGFAFDIIKIDRTYISNLGENRIDAIIVAAICDIARSLPVEVVAEGVETEQQFALLRQAGCTRYQGFLLGRPLPLSELELSRAA